MSGADPNLTRAHSLVESAQGDPAAVRTEAEAIIEATPGSAAAAVGLWARGLAERELGELAVALSSLEQAVSLASELQRSVDAARMRESLAFALFLAGEHQEALHQTELAARHLTGPDAARLRMQQGLIQQRMGDLDAALRSYRHALAGLSRAGDKLGEVRLRLNRSILHSYRWDVSAALSDLERAHQLAKELGQRMLVAGCEHNLGFNEGRRGNVPAALEWFARARESYRAAGVGGGNAAVLEVDHAQLLLDVGLSEEALATAQRAADLLSDAGNEADRSEAVLLAAQAALAADQIETAGRLATEATASFSRQRRGAWRTLAEYVGLQARLAALMSRPDPGDVDSRNLAAAARRAAGALRRHGWQVEALHALTIEARAEIAAGNPRRAQRVLDTAGAARRRGTIDQRMRAWHATALLRMIEGNRQGARRAVRAGLRLLDEQRSSLGATELRASTAAHGRDLAELGVAVALADGRPDQLLEWADRARAGAIRLHPATPPRDRHLAADLTELRRVEQEASEAALSGLPTDQLIRRRAAIEHRIRSRVRQHRGGGEPHTSIRADRIRHYLGHRRLLEYVEHHGHLYAVTADARAYARHDLGPVGDLGELIDRARFDLSRLAHGRGSGAAQEAAERSLADVSRLLQVRILDPIAANEEELVIVPAGRLHGMPWRVLPALARRAFTVAPSAHAWLQAQSRQRRAPAAGILLIAGPDLDHGAREVASIARLYDRATRLSGRNATVDRALEALELTPSAHIVAHGHFRADNPMFSSLQMSDGPLTVYDMERLKRVPQTITLPACDAAVTGLRPGDELLGLAAALVALGVRTLIVPQVPIPDADTPALMRALHRNLLRGLSPSRALAEAVVTADRSSPAARSTAMSFIVMGA